MADAILLALLVASNLAWFVAWRIARKRVPADREPIGFKPGKVVALRRAK